MSRVNADVDELTARARTRVGQRIRGKWHLDSLLGVGGMAAVYAATHRNGKRVAIKILHREVAMSDESRARFTREGYAANAVMHKGAVGVIDDDVTEDGAPFFTMDLLDGETLDQRLRRKGRLEVEEVLAAAYQLLDVLAAAHGRGIVHRDIKPENVFLTRDASVKVLDFGIAYLRDFNGALTSATLQSGQTMGTPSFMPPEQARGRWEDVDARSDLWATGATMFTLLTGRHVHEADTMNEVLLSAMTTAAKPIAQYRPELPKAVSALIDRALTSAMGDRWQSAKAMQDAVREAYRAIKNGDPGSEPMLAPVSGPSLPAPPQVWGPKGPTVTTARPTTHAPYDDPEAHAARRTKIGIAVGAAVGVLLAVVSMFANLTGPGARGVASATGATDPSANASTMPAPDPPSTGAPTVTVLPPPGTESTDTSDTTAAEATPKPVVEPKWRPRPRHAPPAVATPPPPVASSPPPPPSDPLTRRH